MGDLGERPAEMEDSVDQPPLLIEAVPETMEGEATALWHSRLLLAPCCKLPMLGFACTDKECHALRPCSRRASHPGDQWCDYLSAGRR